MTPNDDDHDGSPQTGAALVRALRSVIEFQRLTIRSMEASHFWKLRNAWFRFLDRIGRGYATLPEPSTAELAALDAVAGDRYELYRARNRRSAPQQELLRHIGSALVVDEPVTILIDARAAQPADLDATIASLRRQYCAAWNAVVAGPPSLVALADPNDERVRFAAWNEFDVVEHGTIVPLWAGDTLEPEALLAFVVALKNGADVVYADEDRIDARGRYRDPVFKPGWSPETALTRDYVGGAYAVRASRVREAGGWDDTHGSAVWYDLLLRVSERTDAIVHLPLVLYHRAAPREPLALDARDAVGRALERRDEAADVVVAEAGIEVRYHVPPTTSVCVIIPTRDRADLLSKTIGSLFERTTHPTFGVLVVDNGSREPETLRLLDHWRAQEPARFSVIVDNGDFNYARLNNRAVAATDAEIIVLLNSDTEVLAGEWMSAMLGQALRDPIGAVGALLLYDDGAVQHAGVILGGVLGVAGHAHRYRDERAGPPAAALRLDTNYSAVTGACLMIARRKYLEVGGLDEAFAVSYNDVDLCARLRKAGYRNVVVPRARLYHFESKSRGSDDTDVKRRLALAERAAFCARWPDLVDRDPYYNQNLTVDAEDFSLPL